MWEGGKQPLDRGWGGVEGLVPLLLSGRGSVCPPAHPHARTAHNRSSVPIPPPPFPPRIQRLCCVWQPGLLWGLFGVQRIPTSSASWPVSRSRSAPVPRKARPGQAVLPPPRWWWCCVLVLVLHAWSWCGLLACARKEGGLWSRGRGAAEPSVTPLCVQSQRASLVASWLHGGVRVGGSSFRRAAASSTALPGGSAGASSPWSP